MTTKSKIFAALAIVVCLVFLFESFMLFQSSGFTVVLLVKLGIALAAGWYAWKQFRTPKGTASGNGNAV